MIGMRLEIAKDGGFSAIAEQLKELGTVFSGVELIGKRHDDVDMDDIVDSLISDGRDFFSPDDAVAEQVAEAMAKKVEDRISMATEAGRTIKTDPIAAAGLRAAMVAYMDAVVKRIEAQRTASGGAPKQLTHGYAEEKRRKFGFETPIGKASGQLLAALTAGGAASGKIQLIRK
jgi:hypothetical protein